MIDAHFDAVRALLEAEGLTVHDGEVPNEPSLPYVLLWSSTGLADGRSLEAVSTRRDFVFGTNAVGRTAESARIVADKVHDALVDVRPTVTGRQCWPVEHLSAPPIYRDDDVDPALFVAADQWRLLSIPA